MNNLLNDSPVHIQMRDQDSLTLRFTEELRQDEQCRAFISEIITLNGEILMQSDSVPESPESLKPTIFITKKRY